MGFNSTNIPPEIIAQLPAYLQEQVPLYDQNRQFTVRATLAGCTAITYVALGLRLLARWVTKQAVGLDDLFTVLAAVFTTIGVALLFRLTDLGLGRHDVYMAIEHMGEYNLLNNLIISSCCIYSAVIFCIKASALFLYRRIFQNRCFHIVCYTVLAFTTLYTVASLLVLTISCLPPLTPTPESPVAWLKCPEAYLKVVLLVIFIVNVVLDGIILSLPLPLLWRLHTTTRKKLQLTLVFTLGSFTFAISILRVVSIKKPDGLDNNWDYTSVQLWSIAESASSIVTISLPVMQPALRRVIYRKDGSSRISTSSKMNSPKQNKKSYINGPTSLLTFGRTGMKGPSGRKPRGLDLTTIEMATNVDTNFNSSGTRLVSEDPDNHDTAYVESSEGPNRAKDLP